MRGPTNITTSVLLGSVLGLAGCDGSGDETAEKSTDPTVTRTCPPPAGFEAAPTSVQDVVDRINVLPMPVSLPCFLESLPRPLSAYATTSRFSAQPAGGERSPRVFLFEGDFILTVVPEGSGHHLLEMSEVLPSRLSLKAEIEFPVEAPLSDSAPYDQVRNDAGGATNCSTCHGLEQSHPSIPGAYLSEALQPDPELQVPLSFVMQNARDCDPQAEPDRCGILQALFLHGEVHGTDFADYRICRGF